MPHSYVGIVGTSQLSGQLCSDPRPGPPKVAPKEALLLQREPHWDDGAGVGQVHPLAVTQRLDLLLRTKGVETVEYRGPRIRADGLGFLSHTVKIEDLELRVDAFRYRRNTIEIPSHLPDVCQLGEAWHQVPRHQELWGCLSLKGIREGCRLENVEG